MSRKHSRGSKLTPALGYICLHILRPQDEVMRKYKRQFQEFFDELVEFMEDEDEIFYALYSKPSYQGSTYENTKIILPNEFDINLELRLSDYFDMKIDVKNTYPGHARLQLDRKSKVPNKKILRRIMEEWLDENDYLCLDEVLNWLKSVVDRSLITMRNIKVKRRHSGPAVTLIITSHDSEFSVDLVPAVYFKTECLPKRQYNLLMNVCQDVDISDLGWHLVPKRPRDELGNLVDDVTQWRMSFYLYERKLMRDLFGLKPTYRLLKWFRDRQQWTKLSSYFLKTLFLWELQNQGPDFWKKTSLGDLFLHMLDCLKDHLKDKRIPFFWNQKLNLVGHLSDQYLKKTCDKLVEFIDDINEALDEDDDDDDDDDEDDDASAAVLEEMFNVTLYQKKNRNPVIAIQVQYLHQDLINNSKHLVF